MAFAPSVSNSPGDVVAYGRYYQELARLLILAKLGDRIRDNRGNLYGPTFTKMSE